MSYSHRLLGDVSQLQASSTMSVQVTTTNSWLAILFGNDFANDLMMEYINNSFIFLHQ